MAAVLRCACIAGANGCICPPFMPSCDVTRPCLAGLIISVVEMVLLAFVRNSTDAISVLCAGTVANVSFPAIASIKSNNVAPHEQVPTRTDPQSAGSKL